MSWTSVIGHSPVQVGVGCDNPFNQFVASFANAFRSKNVRSIDYERARIWRSGALETSRHDQSVQQPCQEFGGATWAGSVLRRVAPDQTEVRANSYAVGRSCRRPARTPRDAASGCDPYRSSRPCAPEAPGHGAG